MTKIKRLAYGLVDFLNFLESNEEINRFKQDYKVNIEYTGYCEWNGHFDTEDNENNYELKRLMGITDTQILVLDSNKEVQTENPLSFIDNILIKGDQSIDLMTMGVIIYIYPFRDDFLENRSLLSRKELLIDMLLSYAKKTWCEDRSFLNIQRDPYTHTFTMKLESNYVPDKLK